METGWNLIWRGELVNDSPLTNKDMELISTKEKIVKKEGNKLTYIPVRDCRRVRTIII